MINAAGERLIKQYEGFRDTGYLCPAGIPTIGWGSTHIFGRKVIVGEHITPEQAQTQFQLDVSVFEHVVAQEVHVNLNENQRAALVSFVYNVGPGNFETSTLLRKLNSGHPELVASELMKWNKAGGRELPGLTKRRQAEAALFDAQ